MLGVFAEFESHLRRERQLEGISAAEARGLYKGREPSIDAAEVVRLRLEKKLELGGSVSAERASSISARQEGADVSANGDGNADQA